MLLGVLCCKVTEFPRIAKTVTAIKAIKAIKAIIAIIAFIAVIALIEKRRCVEIRPTPFWHPDGEGAVRMVQMVGA